MPANFPNFANKLSDVKIPRWIVKVLASSAIPQSPSTPSRYTVRVRCSAQQSLLSREKTRDIRIARNKDIDRTNGGLRKSMLVLYPSRLAATVSGKAQRDERGETKEEGVDKSS